MKSTVSALLIVLFGLFMTTSCSNQDNSTTTTYPVMCPTDYNPICGMDGKTYSNECNARGASIAYKGECNDAGCTCPEGYRRMSESCTPECYFSTPRCMMPSIQCRPEGCGECPQFMPPGPDFCTNGTIVAGEKDACGCQGPPKCERNSDNKIPEFCSSWFDGCNNCFVTDGKIMGCTKKYCRVMEEPKCLEYKMPDNCISWFDGCNACGVRDGTAYACTEKYCMVMEEPKCLEYKIPDNCISWFDGCNNCGAKDGNLTMCTLMYCENPVEPKCLEYAK